MLRPLLPILTALALVAAGPADATPRRAHHRAVKAKTRPRVAAKQTGRFHLPGLPAAPSPVPASPVAAPALATPVTSSEDGATAPVAPVVPLPATTSPEVPVASALGVQERELPSFTTVLSRSSVPAGPVVVQLQNTGEDPHNLRIMRTDGTGTAYAIDTVAPGHTGTKVITLTKGSWRLYCTLTAPVSHDGAGMHATLLVE